MPQANPRVPFRPASSDKDDDDSISLASTTSLHDPDQEYVVEAVLAERRHTDGTMYYLIEWEGYPLHECTWEPESNLNPELKAYWEEEKAKHAAGESEPFDIRIFEEAQNEEEESEGETSGIETSGTDEPAVEKTMLQGHQKARKQARSPKPASILAAVPLIGNSQRLNGTGPRQSVIREAHADLMQPVPETRQPMPSRAGNQGPGTNVPASTTTADTVSKSDGSLATAVGTTIAASPRLSASIASAGNAQSPEGLTISPARVLPSPQENDHGSPLDHTQALTTAINDPMSAKQSQEAAHQKKKRKSVRFEVSDDTEYPYASSYDTERAGHGSPVTQGCSQSSPFDCELQQSGLNLSAPASDSQDSDKTLIFGQLLVRDCRRMLPSPNPSPSPPPELAEEPRLNARIQNGLATRELLFRRLFDFDYDKLLPTVLLERPPAEHCFFLAIPKTREEIEHALCHWLRARNPQCRIFTSQLSGGWDAFRSVVNAMPGVVIIHELLGWSLRRFPNLARYLITRSDEYWCISEPIHSLPLYPSIPVAESPAPPGDMRLIRLFPYRTVFFLTPSFLVSEPRRSFEFFEWFTSNWVKKFPYRLVTAYNVHEYLSKLAEEKYWARQKMLNCPGDTPPEIEANLWGLTKDDCNCRYAVAKMATDLHLTRLLQAGAQAQDEENSSLIYADPSIDPNDEQSLVNWFGWWATLQADQFRRFHVIGSSRSIKLRGCRRGERLVRIPKYSKVTLNDPDAVLEVVQEMNDQADTAKASTHIGEETSPQLPPDRVSRPRLSDCPWSFRSDLIRAEDSGSFSKYLETLTRLPGGKSLWGLYKFPVSWLDLEMATHFGDFTSRFTRIQDWFKFAIPFCKVWDYPDVVPPSRPLERHPWIAVYRPVNLHKKAPYTRCEVIIWDPAARTKYPNGQAPTEKDLIFMQRQLIQHVRDHCDEKNYGTWLDQVWYGGWDWPADCDSENPIDVTLLFLKKMLVDMRDYLPAQEFVMEERGWKRVALGPPFEPSPEPPREEFVPHSASSDNRSNTNSSSFFVDNRHHKMSEEHVPMDLDDVEPSTSDDDGGGITNSVGREDAEADLVEYKDEDIRIIFHPPRGHSRSAHSTRGAPLGRSKCINHLYEEAKIARARTATAGGNDNDGVTHMRYTFVPTLDWYREQQAEGRGFAHVNVDSWEGIFGLLKIGNEGSKNKGAGVASLSTTAGTSGGGAENSSRGDASADAASTRTRGSVDSGRESAGFGSTNGAPSKNGKE
ncbi:hypothetical protein VTH82DRAFT_106 [Thermothelomyces myriococcoides]